MTPTHTTLRDFRKITIGNHHVACPQHTDTRSSFISRAAFQHKSRWFMFPPAACVFFLESHAFDGRAFQKKTLHPQVVVTLFKCVSYQRTSCTKASSVCDRQKHPLVHPWKRGMKKRGSSRNANILEGHRSLRCRFRRLRCQGPVEHDRIL